MDAKIDKNPDMAYAYPGYLNGETWCLLKTSYLLSSTIVFAEQGRVGISIVEQAVAGS